MNTPSWSRRLGASFAVAAAAMSLSGAAHADILIGQTAGFTGQVAASVKELTLGAKLYIDKVNANGGVNGQKLQLVTGDDACDPKQATAVANKMVADKVVFVAGKPSHGYGAHEHNGGCLLLARELQRAKPGYEVVVYRNGWPTEANAFDGADTIVMYCDGGGGQGLRSRVVGKGTD